MQTTLPADRAIAGFPPWYVNGLLDWLHGNYNVLRGADPR